MKAKKSPWSTSKVGQTWSAAGRRHLDIASYLNYILTLCYNVGMSVTLFCVHTDTVHVPPSEAEAGDTLQELFGPMILTERPRQHVWKHVFDMLTCPAPSAFWSRNGSTLEASTPDGFRLVCDIIGKCSRTFVQCWKKRC